MSKSGRPRADPMMMNPDQKKTVAQSDEWRKSKNRCEIREKNYNHADV